jgi:hypothetical protein
MGIRNRIRVSTDNWLTGQMQRHDEQARGRLNQPSPEAEARAERFWQAQRELPLHRRSRGWWIEDGIPVLIGAVFAWTMIGLLISWLLSLL